MKFIIAFPEKFIRDGSHLVCEREDAGALLAALDEARDNVWKSLAFAASINSSTMTHNEP